MTTQPELPWRETKDGFALRFRLTPKSSRDAIEGLEQTADGPAFKARVRAVPEDGAANAALEKLAALWLGLPRSAATLTAGHKSRVKTILLVGDRPNLDKRLQEKYAETAAQS